MSNGIAGLKRFLHWGPILGFSIILCVTLTTLHMNSMFWPPYNSLGGFLNQAVFLMFSSVALFNYIMAILTGPGFLPKNWKPQDPKAVEQLLFCEVCKGYKAPRSHHCRQCNRCIKKMDHHCPWINHCVGWANHAYFNYFVSFTKICFLHGAVILCISFYRGIHRNWYLSQGLGHLATVQFSSYSVTLCGYSMTLALSFIVFLGIVLYLQVCWWSHKITLYDVNEVFEEEKADDGGQYGSNVPVDTISSESDSDDLDPQLKRIRFASPGPSTL